MVHSHVNPYKPDGLRQVIDVGVQPTTKKAVYATYQFSQDYLVATEKIELDAAEYGASHFDGWAIRKCKLGQDPKGEVKDRKGVSKKPFNFTGRLQTLPELQRALALVIEDSKLPAKVTPMKAFFLKPNKFGVVDISSMSEPTYSDRVSHRLSYILITKRK